MKLSYDKTEFLNSVIDYCSTNDRAKYLKELAAKGIFTVVDPKKLLEEYLEDTEICQPGKNRALEYFGFTTKPKIGVTRYVIDVEYEISDKYPDYGDAAGKMDSGTVWGAFSIIEDALMKAGKIYDAFDSVNKIRAVTLPDYRTNIIQEDPPSGKSFNREVLSTTKVKGKIS